MHRKLCSVQVGLQREDEPDRVRDWFPSLVESIVGHAQLDETGHHLWPSKPRTVARVPRFKENPQRSQKLLWVYGQYGGIAWSKRDHSKVRIEQYNHWTVCQNLNPGIAMKWGDLSTPMLDNLSNLRWPKRGLGYLPHWWGWQKSDA